MHEYSLNLIYEFTITISDILLF